MHRKELIMAEATFAAGCFWGVEQVFSGIKGVTSTCVGYAGGNFDNPTNCSTCSGIRTTRRN